MPVRIRYDLAGAGWADCSIEIDGQSLTASASYLSDALDDLAAAIVAIVRGDSSASAVFSEEPGEFRWLLERVGATDLQVRLFWSLKRWQDQPHDPTVPLFDARCRLRTFAGQFLSELQRLLDQYGEDGYRERWVRHDFPRKRIGQLTALLATDALRARHSPDP